MRRKLNTQLAKCLAAYTNSKWHDLSHVHPSLNGYKRRSLTLLVEMDRQIRARLNKRHDKWQTWILIDLENPDYDAVYAHTPNANGTPFPVQHSWGRITKQAFRYFPIISALKSLGYDCRKIKKHRALIATKVGP